MDDQKQMTTYGNHDLPNGTDVRPLVTFALFAYNQERYVREAVEGALSQTYSPLEIILSDDCSSDRTFEIMQEMAARYDGPHDVVVRTNERNLGLIDHVNAVIDSAKGDPIIFAAGDDISCPQRTEKIYLSFLADPAALLVHSSVLTVDHTGIETGLRSPRSPNFQDNLITAATSASLHIGASGAIRRKLYEIFGPISERDTYEDLILGFRASLLKSCRYIADPLLYYRTDIGISSQYKRRIGRRRERRITWIKHRVATLRQRKNDIVALNFADIEIISAIENELEINNMRLNIHTDPVEIVYSILQGQVHAPLKALSSEIKYLLGFTQ